MSTQPPLTEAEQAVAAILRRGWANGRGLQVPIEDRARELVAAVRDLIATEALEQAANAIDEDAKSRHARVMAGKSSESFEFIEGMGHALELVEEGVQSLSRPTSEEQR